MSHEITLQFYRTSRNARKFKRIAENFHFHQVPKVLDDPCQVAINDQCDIEDFKRLNYFWKLLRKYNDTVMFAGEKILTREQAEDIFNWIRCYCNHQAFPDQQEYCYISPGVKHLHGWGCKWIMIWMLRQMN